MGLRWPVPSMRPRAPCFSLWFRVSHTHTHTHTHGTYTQTPHAHTHTNRTHLDSGSCIQESGTCSSDTVSRLLFDFTGNPAAFAIARNSSRRMSATAPCSHCGPLMAPSSRNRCSFSRSCRATASSSDSSGWAEAAPPPGCWNLEHGCPPPVLPNASSTHWCQGLLSFATSVTANNQPHK